MSKNVKINLMLLMCVALLVIGGIVLTSTQNLFILVIGSLIIVYGIVYIGLRAFQIDRE